MNRSNFMRKTTRWAGLFILVLAADAAFAQVEPTKPAKAKRVFTNDDLSRFGEKYGSDTPPTQVSAPKGTPDAGKSDKSASEPKAAAQRGAVQMGWEAERSRNRFGESKSRPGEIQRSFGEIRAETPRCPN